MNIENLAFATGKALYPIGEGGGETIANDLLTGLANSGVNVYAHGIISLNKSEDLNHALISLKADLSINYNHVQMKSLHGNDLYYPRDIVYQYQLEYPSFMTTHDYFDQLVENQLKDHRCQGMLFQGEQSPRLFQIAAEQGVFPIFYLQNGLELNLFKKPSDLPLILTNSRFYQERVLHDRGLQCELLYPAVDLDRYVVEENTHEFVTMVNPILVKGIVPFLQLAIAMPERRFLVVEGWGTSKEIYDMIQQIPNVAYLPKQVDMRKVYGQTHILVVPSQWEEAFGRVITEAQVNGIPVLASAVGGIPEALGDGGVLVQEIQDSKAWARGLGVIEADYDDLSERARDNARRFSVENAVRRFQDILASIDR